MKTIAYVLTDFPVLSETFIGNEIRAMEKRGHRIVPIVFSLRDGPAQPEDRAIAERAVRLAAIGADKALNVIPHAWRGLGFTLRQQRLPRRSLLWNGMKIAGLAQAERCDHIHAHFAGGGAAHALVAGQIAGLPVSFTCHGHDVYAEPEDLEAKLAAADRVVAVCDDLEQDLRAMRKDANVARIACGTDPDKFTPRPAGTPDNGRLLFVGRLVEQKGIDDLLAALRLIGDDMPVQIDIVGDGPLRDAIALKADAIGEEGTHIVSLLGAKDAHWLKREVPAYRAVCLPFKTASDGSRDTGPLVVKEAMAMGLPVISTAYMGVKETVTRETGILVPPGDPLALAEAIRVVNAMPREMREAMGAAGRRRVVGQFTLSRQAKALSAMVEAA
ncbi:MAG TPA: glycosyltransferase [Rhizobiaceae bacterium]|nr:glycosyltransferase [Rhizobiaceae bacterium]